MATFVLVHGSYHGGWCWQKVARLLRQRGHDVYTPTLTGLGERSHLCTPQVGLDLHIRDITQVLEYEDLREVMLTGHSYGGMVITGVAAACPQRLARLIYLDAFVPQDGQSVFDLRPGMQERWEGLAACEGQGWCVPPPDPAAMGVSNAADAAWVQPRLTPMPLATHQQPLRLPSGLTRQVLRTYFYAVWVASRPLPKRYKPRGGTTTNWRPGTTRRLRCPTSSRVFWTRRLGVHGAEQAKSHRPRRR